MRCSRCGNENPENARFCANCGNPLQEDATVRFTPAEAEDEASDRPLQQGELQGGQALLVVQRGPNAGSKFLIDKDVTTTGRHPESDIFLDDVTVSRRHAVFRRTQEGYVVSDVGSLNGTYVNRDRVDEVLLSGGDEVQIGKYRLVYFPSQAGVGGPAR